MRSGVGPSMPVVSHHVGFLSGRLAHLVRSSRPEAPPQDADRLRFTSSDTEFRTTNSTTESSPWPAAVPTPTASACRTVPRSVIVPFACSEHPENCWTFVSAGPQLDMAEQRYVYTTTQTQVRGEALNSIESIINEYASQGWRFVETLDRDGTTIGLVFEQER